MTRGCAFVRGRLAAFSAGDLPEDRDRPVREHLASCVGCRRELAEWLELRRALDATRREAFTGVDDAWFRDLARGSLRAVEARSPVPPAVRQRRRFWRAAAAGVLFTIGLGLGVFGIFERAEPPPGRDLEPLSTLQPLAAQPVRAPARAPELRFGETQGYGVSLPYGATQPVGDRRSGRAMAWQGLGGHAEIDRLLEQELAAVHEAR